MQTSLPDVSHLSDKQRAMLAQRLRGRTDIETRNEPPAPDTLMEEPAARHDWVPLRDFVRERQRYETEGQGDYRLWIETCKIGLSADRYEAAWHKLARITDALRTRIGPGGMRVLPEDTPFLVIRHDARKIFEDKSRLALIDGARARIEDMCKKPDAPSAVVALIQMTDDQLYCLYSFDLRVFDLPSVEFMALRCRRIYDDTLDDHPPLHTADYRRTEAAWLASSDGQDAKRHWMRRFETTPARLTGADLAAPEGESGYGYLCVNTPKDVWLEGQRIAAQLGVSELMVVQVLFTDLLAHLSNKSAFTYETRSFQRLPFHEDIYELLGQFTLGSLTGRPTDAAATFVERVRAEQIRSDKSAPFAFFDAASHWQAQDDRGSKIVFTNTCNRFEEFVLAGNVPPMRWFGRYQRIEQHNPDTALEYVLVENAGDLENHWFINHGLLPREWSEQAHKMLCGAIERLCSSPDAWTVENLFSDMEMMA